VPELFAFTLFVAITLTVSLRSTQGGDEGSVRFARVPESVKRPLYPSAAYFTTSLQPRINLPRLPTQPSQLTLGTTPYTTNMVQWTLEKDQLVSTAEQLNGYR
jgi:hypothetical protein